VHAGQLPTAFTGNSPPYIWSSTTANYLSLQVTGCGGCSLPVCGVAYKFIVQSSLKTIHINGADNTDNNIPLIQWDNSGGLAQESYYFFPNSDGSYYITSKISGKRIDVTSVAQNSDVVQTIPNYSGDNQKWILSCVGPNNIFTITPKSNTGLMWNVAGGGSNNGANLLLWPPPAASNSQFQVLPW